MSKEDCNINNTESENVQTDDLDISVMQNSNENSASSECPNNSGDAVTKKQAFRGKSDKIISTLLLIAICILACVLLLKVFVVEPIMVSGSSMMPNLNSKTTVWASKVSSPKRGDIVVFLTDFIDDATVDALNLNDGTGWPKKYIKRVVALEGEKVWAVKQNGDYVLYIQTTDGEIYEESYFVTSCYLAIDGRQAGFYDKNGNIGDIPYLGEIDKNSIGVLVGASQENPYIVPEDCFFALGDNRLVSQDCRYFGAVPLSSLYGVVIG